MILWRNIENYHVFIILIPTPDILNCYYMFGANLGSVLYGDDGVMFCICKINGADQLVISAFVLAS